MLLLILWRFSLLKKNIFCMLVSTDNLWQGNFHSKVMIYKQKYLAEFYKQNAFCISKLKSSL